LDRSHPRLAKVSAHICGNNLVTGVDGEEC
jgi:hypothetical protein